MDSRSFDSAHFDGSTVLTAGNAQGRQDRRFEG
jgi:hypothetical protein